MKFVQTLLGMKFVQLTKFSFLLLFCYSALKITELIIIRTLIKDKVHAHKTLWLMIKHYQTKFGCQGIKSS